jgi:hypothetical protein
VFVNVLFASVGFLVVPPGTTPEQYFSKDFNFWRLIFDTSLKVANFDAIIPN